MDELRQPPRGPVRRAVVLAGGASTRLPGGKPSALLWGRTLLDHAVAVVLAAGLDPIVLARANTPLPPTDATVWREPWSPAAPHPLAAIAWALTRAEEPLAFLPVDMPLLPPSVLRAVAASASLSDPAVVTREGRAAALVLAAAPVHVPRLTAAAEAGEPVLRTIVGLGARHVELGEPPRTDPLSNVNTPAALARLDALPPQRY